MELIFATGNKGKLREAREIFSGLYSVISAGDAGYFLEPEETGGTFRENSLIKAQSLWDALHKPCFADDSGLEIDALGGAPGIYSARYAGLDKDFSHNIDKVLSQMKGISDRRARFRCVVTLMLDGTPHYFDGTLEGKIAEERSGSNGFGYDPIFIADAFPQVSLACVSEEEKNGISHRGQALRLMADFLKRF